jgi:hypothetical protein
MDFRGIGNDGICASNCPKIGSYDEILWTLNEDTGSIKVRNSLTSWANVKFSVDARHKRDIHTPAANFIVRQNGMFYAYKKLPVKIKHLLRVSNLK